MTATAWIVIAGSALATFVIKAAGPVALGGRELPGRLSGVVALMAPALLAGLVVTSALAEGQELGVGADTAGVAAAGIVLWRGGTVLPAVLTAGVVTALLRAIL